MQKSAPGPTQQGKPTEKAAAGPLQLGKQASFHHEKNILAAGVRTKSQEQVNKNICLLINT